MLNIQTLVEKMGDELKSYGEIISFLEIRLSAERFIVPILAFGAQNYLDANFKDRYHVYFEKKVIPKRGPVDLVIVPVEGNNENWRKSYKFEFKMIWKGSLTENVSGVRDDLQKLKDDKRGYVVGILFTFDGGPNWTRYHHKENIDVLIENVRKRVKNKPEYCSKRYPMENVEVKGNIKLAVWKS